MTSNAMIRYCRYYKGEAICPPQYDGTNAGKLWQAEKFVCEEFFNLINWVGWTAENSADPYYSFIEYVSAYVEKWSPYKCEEIMNEYFNNRPDKYSDIRSKTIFDFCNDEQMIADLVVSKEDFLRDVKDYPLLNAHVLIEYAEMTNDDALLREVLWQYKAELEAENNE